MTNKILKGLGLLAFTGALLSTPAYAVDVTYDTTGLFSACGVGFTCAGNVLAGPSGLSITFLGASGNFVSDVPPPTNAGFGLFLVSGPTPATVTDTVAAAFSLDVTQVTPLPGGTQTLSGVMAGTIKLSNSQVNLSFSSGTGPGGAAVLTTDPLGPFAALKFSLGSVIYWVDTDTKINPATAQNLASINGAISAVPEPGFYGLTGAGLAGLLAMRLRRKKQAAV